MRYLCLIYYDEKALAALPTEQSAPLWSGSGACRRDPGASRGCLVAALQPVREAITVRARDGRVHTTGGPFAKTEEQLGGLMLIDADDLDDALAVAGRLPAARFGSVEVRPIMEHARPPSQRLKTGLEEDRR